jgi:di/tricarboxylate transporter
MNNIAATAVLMPAVASLSRRAGLQPSKIFMPLSFGAILGGTTTLVGTPPNILAGSVLAERGLTPFELFDFTPLGAVLLALGVIYMVTIGRKLLPDHKLQEDDTGQELVNLYRLEESLFTIRIPAGSPIEGKTLAETGIGNALGIQIIAVLREGKRMLAPPAETHLRTDDELLVSGSRERLSELLQIQGLDVDDTTAEQLGVPQRGVSGVKLRLNKESQLLGKSLRDYGLRERLGVAVMAIERNGERFTKSVGDIALEEEDILFGIGASEKVANLAEQNHLFDVQTTGVAALSELSDEPVLVLRLPEDSPLVEKTIAESQVSELMSIMIIGILRGDKVEWSVSPDEILKADDRLFVSGEKEKLKNLLKIGNVELASHPTTPGLESEEVGVVEATIAPRSSLDGRTLGEVNFRQRRGLQVLAVWREGHPIREHLADLSLRVGDGLLLQGKRGALAQLPQDEDLVVLSRIFGSERKVEKAPYAVGGLLLMIAFVITGFQPIHVAAFAAATFVVLTGVISMKESYRIIEWRAIFLVAAVLPVGAAMESSGTALLISQNLVVFAGELGPYAVLAALIVLSSLLSQGLDGAPAVVLLTPVVLSTAEKVGISPYPLMMGVALAASAAFMTPFSHKANLLVMGAGGYRSWDYVKVGTPLTIVILVTLVFLVPVFFPF